MYFGPNKKIILNLFSVSVSWGGTLNYFFYNFLIKNDDTENDTDDTEK